MKKIVSFISLLLMGLPLLTGCNGPPLLEGGYSRMETVKGGELVHETRDAREIEAAIDLINSSKREETHTWELPEPIGTLTFFEDSEEISLPLYEDGVVVDDYFVYANFDF